MTTIVLAHPWHGSFNKSILDSIVSKLEEGNRKYNIIDLNKENFDPVFREEELKLYKDGGFADDQVGDYQKILNSSSELIVIFPIWWYNMPAILKGFIDKVMLRGFAYNKNSAGFLIGSLENIKRTFVITTSEAPTWYLKFMGNPIKRVLTGSTLKQIGLKNIKWFNSENTTSDSNEKRQKFLDKVISKIS